MTLTFVLIFAFGFTLGFILHWIYRMRQSSPVLAVQVVTKNRYTGVMKHELPVSLYLGSNLRIQDREGPDALVLTYENFSPKTRQLSTTLTARSDA